MKVTSVLFREVYTSCAVGWGWVSQSSRNFSREVVGMASVAGDLYVALKGQTSVLVMDSVTLDTRRSVAVPEIRSPTRDLAAGELIDSQVAQEPIECATKKFANFKLSLIHWYRFVAYEIRNSGNQCQTENQMEPDKTRSSAVAKRPCDCCMGQFWPNETGRRYFADIIISLSLITVT